MESKQEKDLNPYEFTLEIDGEPMAIRVEVPKEGDYVVYINGERTGHLSFENGSEGKTWFSKDEIAKDLVNRIGEQIEVLEAGEVH